MTKQVAPPTVAELATFLKRKGQWSTLNGDVKVPVTIVDARSMFGRLELKVTPVGGSGATWTVLANVDLEEA